MTKKYFRLLLSLGVILCILCASFTVAAAAPRWGDFTGEVETDKFDDEETTEVTTTEEETTEVTTTQPVETTAPSTTQKPTKQPDNTVNNTVQTTKENDKSTTKAETKAENTKNNTKITSETETVPEGIFTVYLECNNGEPRKRFDLEKPDLVPQPNEPYRKGYIFKGWFGDAACTIPWDFSKSIADRGTVIYAKWEMDENTIAYNISVIQSPGGIIEVNPSFASAGEAVVITVKPDEGKRLVPGSVTINGKSQSALSFLMRGEDVVVSVSFEDVPEEIVEEKEFPIVPVAIGAVVALIILVVVIIIIRYKTRPAVLEYDENGAIILDDDDYDGWVDESIIIEDGFANGKIVHESIESDNAIHERESINKFDNERTD